MQSRHNHLIIGFLVVGLTVGHITMVRAADQLASADKAAPSEYSHLVQTKIANAISYPRMAKLRKEEGTVDYAVQIEPEGTIAQVMIESSSGSSALDSEVQAAVKRAAPFPAMNDHFTIHGKAHFSLSE